ncbi:MAG: PilZ domain-containing protein [Planctomycetota bacterium]
MSHSDSPDRSSDRFGVSSDIAIPAEMLVGLDDEIRSFPCRLADISVNGCAVRVTMAPNQAPTVAVIRFKDLADVPDLEVAGRVCWARQTSVGTMTLGFRFRRPISADTLSSMIDSGWVSRRHSRRIKANLPVSVRRKLGQQPIEVAELIDVSGCGLQLSTEHALQVGEQVLISTPEGVSAPVTIVWSTNEQPSRSGAGFLNAGVCRTFVDAARKESVRRADQLDPLSL